MLGKVEVSQGLRQECVLSPLLLRVFFVAILLVALERFSEEAYVLQELPSLKDQPSMVGPETVQDCAWRAILRMLYADDACIVSKSLRGSERMMAVFLEFFGAFGPYHL